MQRPTEFAAAFVRTEVTDESLIARAVEVASQQDGPFSGVVNCAGIGVAAKMIGKKELHSLDDFMRVLTVNLGGTFNVIRLASDVMRNNEPGPSGARGVIVNTASVAVFDGQICNGCGPAPSAMGRWQRLRRQRLKDLHFQRNPLRRAHCRHAHQR